MEVPGLPEDKHVPDILMQSAIGKRFNIESPVKLHIEATNNIWAAPKPENDLAMAQPHFPNQ